MKSLLLTFLFCFLVLLVSQIGLTQSGPHDTGTAVESKDGEKALVSVIVSNQGFQRRPILPIVLYANDFGWRRRFRKFPPSELEDLRGEKTPGRVLEGILEAVKLQDGWIFTGRYGNTEFAFYRADGSSRAFTLNRTNTTLVFQNIKNDLPTNSIVWDYVNSISREFPHTDEGPQLLPGDSQNLPIK